jgi:hypothetical protein
MITTYIFDVWARVDSDDIAVFNPQVVSNNSVYPSVAIFEVVIGKNDQYGVLSLFSLH